jgi:hypothetical protein
MVRQAHHDVSSKPNNTKKNEELIKKKTNMKPKNIIAALFCSVALLSTAQTTQRREITSFDKIDASGAANIKFTTSDSLKLTITGDADELANVETKVQDGILFIKTKGVVRSSPKIEVFAPTLNLISLSGASSFETKNELKTDSLNLEASGASNATINTTCKAIKATISGASEVNLSGVTINYYANVSGASTLKSYKLVATNTWATASGASTAKVYSEQKIVANATGASTIKFKGDPKEVSAEGSSSSQIMKVNADDTVAKKNNKDSTSTSFNLGNKKIIISDDDGNDTIRKRNHGDFKYWSGFFIGSNGYMSPSGGFTIPKPYDYMELDYSKSLNWQLNLVQQNIHLYKNYVNLVTGIGFTWNQYELANKTKLNADSSFTWGKVDSTNTFGYRKNRFRTSYVTVPLLLDFNTNSDQRKSFHISLGVVGGYLLGGKTKQVLVKDNVEYKNIRKDTYNLSAMKLDAYASIAYRRITVFAEYSLTPMFKDGKGPELYPFSAGVRIVGFDNDWR